MTRDAKARCANSRGTPPPQATQQDMIGRMQCASPAADSRAGMSPGALRQACREQRLAGLTRVATMTGSCAMRRPGTGDRCRNRTHRRAGLGADIVEATGRDWRNRAVTRRLWPGGICRRQGKPALTECVRPSAHFSTTSACCHVRITCLVTRRVKIPGDVHPATGVVIMPPVRNRHFRV